MTESVSIVENFERRATVRLLRYWASLPRGIAPPMSAFDPSRNPVAWEKCFMVTAGDTPDQVSIEHMGSAIWTLLGGTMAADPAADNLPSLLRSVIDDLARVLDSAEPMEREGSHQLETGVAVQYRSILLPFADFRGRPSYGLGAITLRPLPANASI